MRRWLRGCKDSKQQPSDVPMINPAHHRHRCLAHRQQGRARAHPSHAMSDRKRKDDRTATNLPSGQVR